MALPIPYQVQPDTIYAWDANTLTATMKACGMRVHTVVTSPPYFGLRDYGADGQIGLEPTPDEYVRALVTVFRGVRDVLRDDGTLWLNLGDSYSAGGRGSSDHHRQKIGANTASAQALGAKKTPGFTEKQLLGIPWRVAFALQEDGWVLRSDIVWSKLNPTPESVTDRPTKAHEYIFLFAKSPRYYYDSDAIKEPVAESTPARLQRGVSSEHKNVNGAPGQTPHSMNQPRPNTRKQDALGKRTYTGFNERYFQDPLMVRNKRSVWTVNTEPSPIPHFAMYPQKLIEPCILAGAPVGGIVFDPFMGGGTTALVAQRLGRQYIGSEINPENVEIARYRVSGRIDEYLAKKRGEAFTAYMFEEQTA